MVNSRPSKRMRTSMWLGAGAIAAFAISGQMRILDAATMTLIFAWWAIGVAWLAEGAGGRARWRARLVRLAARGVETIEVLDADNRHGAKSRVPIDQLLGGRYDASGRDAMPGGPP